NPPLVDPPFLCSADGKLAVELEAAPGAFEIAGQRCDGMLYDGAYIPPVWRGRPGDTLTVALRDRVPEGTNLHFHGMPSSTRGDTLTVALRNRLPEGTNLHFHGMHVSPRGDSDNIFLRIHPGESFSYRVEIPPSHPPGLFWYHPHAHGRTSPQILGGMSGGIVVEGSDRYYPLLKDLKERVMLLKHVPDPTQSHQQIVTLNGLVAPTIPIRPGEVQY